MHSLIHKIQNLKSISPKVRYAFLCLFLYTAVGFSQTAPIITSEVDTTFIKIGEQLKFTVTVDADTTAQVIFPEGQTFSPLETVEALPTDTTKKDSRYILQKSYTLTQFDSGQYKLPTQFIDINGKGFYTDSLVVNVATVPVDTLAQRMYDIKPFINVEKNHASLYKILLAILAAVLIVGALLYWFVFRKKPLTEEEKVALLPPYDRALLELKNLENSKYLIQDEYKQYYTELTDIVRSYLEEDVHVSALESTTDQLIEKLEMRRDAGELKLDDETLKQFKQILETADLVKFAKSKPETSVAENHRKSIEQIVIKTHDALPEPTEEELQEQEAYQEELARKKERKKWIIVGVATLGAIILAITGLSIHYGPKHVWDTVTGNESKKLLSGEWVSSSYGYPPILLETPDVLVRQKTKIPAEAQSKIKELSTFGYHNENTFLTIAATSTQFADESEPDHEKTIEGLINGLEKKGAKNIITKNDEYTTISGVKGLKTYGSGQFKVPNSDELVRGKYEIYSFGGPGFQQQILITWLADDEYAEEIVNRIGSTLEVKIEL
ncbi:hypothetical protein [Aurantibacter crassamenti]|uniref:hypothetical protein n=1 Tax=Aurantibacter crassamenti TaxID=1837375 RepID=UPI003741F130